MSSVRTLFVAAVAIPAFTGLGNGDVLAETPAEWQRSLAEHIRCHLVYPNGLGRPTSPRTARVVFTIDVNGHLGNVNVEQSSGVMVFDRAALAAVESADPAPPPPVLPGGVPMKFSLPLTFNPPTSTTRAPLPGTKRPDPNKDDPPVCKDVGIM